MAENEKIEVKKPNYLNNREWKCLELYIKYDNKKQAGIEAGYSEKTAAAQACRLINSDKGQMYLNKRMNQLAQDNSHIADKSEILEFLTSVMRGEVMDIDFKGNQKQVSIQDRTKAAGELAKRLIDNNIESNINITIIDDIPNIEE